MHCVPNCGARSCARTGPALVVAGGQAEEWEWRHVGEGKGRYNVVSKIEYVGEGCGSYMAVRPNWRQRPGVTVAAALAAVVLTTCAVCGLPRLVAALSAPSHLEEVAAASCSGEEPPDTEEAVELCCSHFRKFCAAPSSAPPGVNCSEGLEHWRHGWSKAKKSWCCAREQKGCEPPTTTAPPTAAPSEHVPAGDPALPPLPFLPYDCHAEGEGWELAWSDRKKVWCCEHKGRGCAATEQ